MAAVGKSEVAMPRDVHLPGATDGAALKRKRSLARTFPGKTRLSRSVPSTAEKRQVTGHTKKADSKWPRIHSRNGLKFLF